MSTEAGINVKSGILQRVMTTGFLSEAGSLSLPFEPEDEELFTDLTVLRLVLDLVVLEGRIREMKFFSFGLLTFLCSDEHLALMDEVTFDGLISHLFLIAAWVSSEEAIVKLDIRI